MKLQVLKYFTLLGVLALWQCEAKLDEFKPENGSADFTTFVAIGDSYTSGYTDGALSKAGQKNGFSAILAHQLSTTDNYYDQPFIPEGMSVGGDGNGSYKLVVLNKSLVPFPTTGNPELLSDPSNWVNGQAPFNNIGVPGVKSFHLLAPELGDYTLGEGAFNPFYSRFASAPGTSTMISDAMLKKPTFFSLWAGGNDVLQYALAGGNGKVGGIGINDITDEATFTYSINKALSELTSGKAKGVLGNIPDVKSLPYFNYIAYDGLELDAEKAAMLNAGYEPYNQMAEANGLPQIVFSEGRNAFVIADSSYPLHMRQIKEDEKVLLSASTGILGEAGWGSKEPMPEDQVLSSQELAAIKDATTRFNTIIAGAASQYELPVADINQLLIEAEKGLVIDGNLYTTEFVTGGIFSLDGIHTSGRGSAVITNRFIETINKHYGATVPLVNVNDYPGIEFP